MQCRYRAYVHAYHAMQNSVQVGSTILNMGPSLDPRLGSFHCRLLAQLAHLFPKLAHLFEHLLSLFSKFALLPVKYAAHNRNDESTVYQRRLHFIAIVSLV